MYHAYESITTIVEVLSILIGRRVLQGQLNYEVDSEEDWEEEQDGESIASSVSQPSWVIVALTIGPLLNEFA